MLKMAAGMKKREHFAKSWNIIQKDPVGKEKLMEAY